MNTRRLISEYTQALHICNICDTQIKYIKNTQTITKLENNDYPKTKYKNEKHHGSIAGNVVKYEMKKFCCWR